jgi:hypothetical protein
MILVASGLGMILGRIKRTGLPHELQSDGTRPVTRKPRASNWSLELGRLRKCPDPQSVVGCGGDQQLSTTDPTVTGDRNVRLQLREHIPGVDVEHNDGRGSVRAFFVEVKRGNRRAARRNLQVANASFVILIPAEANRSSKELGLPCARSLLVSRPATHPRRSWLTFPALPLRISKLQLHSRLHRLKRICP